MELSGTSRFQHITKIEMRDSKWRHSTLSVSRGGLGIGRATKLTLPAYVALVYSTLDSPEKNLQKCTDPISMNEIIWSLVERTFLETLDDESSRISIRLVHPSANHIIASAVPR